MLKVNKGYKHYDVYRCVEESAHPTSTHWSTRSRVSSSWSTQESSALHRLIIGSLDTVNIHNRLHLELNQYLPCDYQTLDGHQLV